jgi:hypothetical protein
MTKITVTTSGGHTSGADPLWFSHAWGREAPTSRSFAYLRAGDCRPTWAFLTPSFFYFFFINSFYELLVIRGVGLPGDDIRVAEMR